MADHVILFGSDRQFLDPDPKILIYIKQGVLIFLFKIKLNFSSLWAALEFKWTKQNFFSQLVSLLVAKFNFQKLDLCSLLA